ncbi:MAG: nucleotidyltransferase domain-containing protein [Candidatus Aenigmarchaeota archaeon]|nr:nucleotidyltransferase domain-containing protein [Candidatus Aenigmarchaeota archaeon]
MEPDFQKLSETLEKELGGYTRVAWAFGSFTENKQNDSSDIDVAAVTTDEESAGRIDANAEFLSKSANLNLDIIPFSSNNITQRCEHNDYLLGSIVKNSMYLFGDKSVLEGISEYVHTKKPTEDSVKWNLLQSIYVFDICMSYFDQFKFYSRKLLHDSFPDVDGYKALVFGDAFNKKLEGEDLDVRIANRSLLDTMKNIPVSAGYKLASQKIKTLDRTVDLSDLREHAETQEELFFNDVYDYYKSHKNQNAEPLKVRDYLKTLSYMLQN